MCRDDLNCANVGQPVSDRPRGAAALKAKREAGAEGIVN